MGESNERRQRREVPEQGQVTKRAACPRSSKRMTGNPGENAWSTKRQEKKGGRDRDNEREKKIRSFGKKRWGDVQEMRWESLFSDLCILSFFLGLHPQHMEVPRLGVQSEL